MNSDSNDDWRLSKSHANFVDAIHTCITYGLQVSVGHADFWPNMGKVQPGCMLTLQVACSHMRATELYAESILSENKFQTSKDCASSIHWLGKYCECDRGQEKCNRMGHYADVNKSGNFFVSTNSNWPYSSS